MHHPSAQAARAHRLGPQPRRDARYSRRRARPIASRHYRTASRQVVLLSRNDSSRIICPSGHAPVDRACIAAASSNCAIDSEHRKSPLLFASVDAPRPNHRVDGGSKSRIESSRTRGRQEDMVLRDNFGGLASGAFTRASPALTLAPRRCARRRNPRPERRFRNPAAQRGHRSIGRQSARPIAVAHISRSAKPSASAAPGGVEDIWPTLHRSRAA